MTIAKMTPKEMTAHIRGRVKQAGIKARVRMAPGGGPIQVFAIAYGVEFTEEEQRTIRIIAKTNRLTLVRGSEIIIDQMTNPDDFHFYMAE
jgi:hypothetical protein